MASSDRDEMDSVAHFAEAATSAIHAQRRDINHIFGFLNILGNDVNFLKSFVSDTKQNMTAGRTSEVVYRPSLEQISAITQNPLNLTFSEFEAITGSIARLNTRASEVDGLKLEIQFLKTRLRRLEEDQMKLSRRISSVPHATAVGETFDFTPRPKLTPFPLEFSKKQKTMNAETVSKRNSVQSEDDLEVFGCWKRVRYSDTSASPEKAIPSRTPLPDLPHHNTPDQSIGQASIGDDIDYMCDTEENETYSEVVNGDKVIILNEIGVLTDGDSNEIVPREYDIEYRDLLPTTTSDDIIIDRPSFTPESSSSTSIRRSGRKSRSRRRGRGGSLRDAEGTLITKSGKPDKRAGNYKYLKAYYDNLKVQRENKQQKLEDNPDVEVNGDGGTGEDRDLVVQSPKTSEQLPRDLLERIAVAAHANM